MNVAHAMGFEGTSLRAAAKYLCRLTPPTRTACERIIDHLPLAIPRAGIGSGTTRSMQVQINNSQPLQLAVRCLHLLLWGAANRKLNQWAEMKLLRRGTLLRWQHELMLSPKLFAGLVNSLRIHTLRL